MLGADYFQRCFESIGDRQSPVTMTFILHRAHLAKKEEEQQEQQEQQEQRKPLKRSERVHTDLNKENKQP